MSNLKIQNAAVIGLGALGIIFARKFADSAPQSWVIADRDRIDRYRRDGIFYNDTPCDFRYLAPEDAEQPADLILFCTKFHDLPQAIEFARPFVGENTLVLSLINGITSERLLTEAYGADKVLFCVAQH